MGTVCGDLLSPCVCSTGRLAQARAARMLLVRGRDVDRAERCVGMHRACLCSCPDQSASGFGRGDLEFGRDDGGEIEGNGGDATGGRWLRKVVLERACRRGGAPWRHDRRDRRANSPMLIFSTSHLPRSRVDCPMNPVCGLPKGPKERPRASRRVIGAPWSRSACSHAQDSRPRCVAPSPRSSRPSPARVPTW